MDDPLDRPRPLAVDDAEVEDPPAEALLDVFGDQVLDVLGAEGVKVEHAVDGQLDRVVDVHGRISLVSSEILAQIAA